MKLLMMRGVRVSLLAAAASTIMAGRAGAQPPQPPRYPPGAVVQPLVPDQGSELRRHLTTLADNPRSLDALVGAGRAALANGDSVAALGFFSRANEVAPRDARVKAGMGSVLVKMERGQPALALFAEAASLGAPAWEIAGDRGLAHDMVGDPRRAQQDYALVLQRREDPEVRRRLALSLAISGEREAAMRVIDGQLRRNDRAAWRTQAFILALTGDGAGATRTAQGLMPPASAQAMAPFFARLAGLTPSQKAMAAHFGRFPNNAGAGSALASNNIAADPGALAMAGPPPSQARPQSAAGQASGGSRARSPATGSPPVNARSEPRASASRPPPASDSRPTLMQRRRALAEYERRGASQPPAAVTQQRAEPTARTQPASPPQTIPNATASRPAGTSASPGFSQSTLVPPPVAPPSRPVVAEVIPPATPTSGPDAAQAPPPAATERAAASVDLAARPTSILPESFVSADQPLRSERLPATAVERLASVEATTAREPTVQPTPPETRPAPAQRIAGLSEIAALVATLPEDEAQQRPPPESRPVAVRNPPARARPASTSPSRPGAAHPSRHWVQIAGGANAAALPRELARLRSQAPELAGRDAWVTPANATNRLLVGPFASEAEAQAFVNQLSGRNIASFAWQSEAGQEIARLQSGR